MNELEEILEQADGLKISLSIVQLVTKYGIPGEMLNGKYIPATREILLNPCQSQSELGITFLHELYHDWATQNNRFGSRNLEEYHAEAYAQEMYELYHNEINQYLIDRKLS